jgi:hypothetical protein
MEMLQGSFSKGGRILADVNEGKIVFKEEKHN